ncbi:MAG: OmpA family protein [Alphaproteobacteria bacterium]|nr:MAG: OmpA family protein [Alphaproteobacteria bacterium]
MSIVSKKPGVFLLLAMGALPLAASLSAQQGSESGEILTTVYGSPPADLEGLPEGPELEGFISSRRDDKLQVTSAGGMKTVVALSDGTEIRSKGGFLGTSNKKLGAESLLNGLPVTVETVRWNNSLVASRIDLRTKDLKTAAMIHNGTDQRFGEHDVAIAKNEAATDALRSRVGDIDKYNIKGTTNVYFDTGKWDLSGSAQSELCNAAAEADAMDNALLLVVGYTDNVGNEDYNQVLSEKRAGRVVNFLQQKCGWKPWRMVTPTGMAESDPAADNSTPEGRAQNRRVSVNILVSKAVDEI